MQAAIISPIALLNEYSGLSTFQMALAHLVLQDSCYREFFARRSREGDFVLMDNGVVETGVALQPEQLVRAASSIEASEIVLPDCINNAPGTYARTVKALRWIRKAGLLGSYRLLAVPQGSTALEWLRMVELFSSMPEVDTIGVTKFAAPLVDGGRERLLEAMESLGLVHRHKEYHLLGIWRDPLEVLRVRNAFPWVRSVDSSLPVLSGMCGVEFPNPMRDCRFTRPEGDLNFWAAEDPCPEITVKNLGRYLHWAGAV